MLEAAGGFFIVGFILETLEGMCSPAAMGSACGCVRVWFCNHHCLVTSFIIFLPVERVEVSAPPCAPSG